MERYILAFDELNMVLAETEIEDADEVVLDQLITAYRDGIRAVDKDARLRDPEDEMDDYEDLYIFDVFGTEITDEAYASIFKQTAGETFEDRINAYIRDGDMEAIKRVADTEYHRVFNEAMYNTARRNGYTMKRWVTMRDDRVRDTHWYLDGLSVPIDSYFATYDGDMALLPGGFTLAENNVNCRCVVEYF